MQFILTLNPLLNHIIKLMEVNLKERSNFVGDQLSRCLFKFHTLITLRQKEVPRLSGHYDSELIHEEVKQKLLKGSDEYVNCLTKTYKGEIPDSLEATVNKFKTQLYSELQPVYVIEDTCNEIVEAIYASRQ